MIEKEVAFRPGKPVKALSASSKIQCERSRDMIDLYRQVYHEMGLWGG